MSRLIRAGLPAVLVLVMVVSGVEAGKDKAARSPEVAVQTITVTGIRREQALPENVLAVWTQYGPGGTLEARVAMSGHACPYLALNLKQVLMQVRVASNEHFPTLCSAPIPAETQQATLVFTDFAFHSPYPTDASQAEQHKWMVEEYGLDPTSTPFDGAAAAAIQSMVEEKKRYSLFPLPVPVADPQRILIIGDGGCRSKGDKHQDCSKPEIWPFAQISAEAAKLKPDLIIHVGDFVSREQACPADVPVCQNQPFGDNWAAWDADVFTPMKPLFTVAPIVFARGNHEDCHREGLGYLRLLAPTPFDPAAGCIAHLAPYAVPFAGLTIVVSDNADAPEPSVVEASVPIYRNEIANLAKEKAPIWWVQHRPIWGLISGPLGVPVGGNKTLAASVPEAGVPAPVELMLSGHIHTFEAINYKSARRVPPQLLAGRGGDLMDPTPKDLRGAMFQGSSDVGVKDGISVDGFGYTLMTKVAEGWRIDVYDWQGRIQRICQFHNGRIDCPVHKR